MTARYPDWICHACGTTRGTHQRISTYHEGQCGWCGGKRAVTEPRDYGFPLHPGETQTTDTSCHIRWRVT